MDSYDGTTDPDEHIENIKAILTYRSVRDTVKCKIFVTTLRRGAVTWFKNLRRNSIDSWSDLCNEFTTHFMASRTQPKMVASLEAIFQGRSETLRDYIERFNEEAVQVRGANETMKLYLIAKGLREETDVKKVVLLDRPRTLNEFLAIAKIYIAYEEALYVDNLNKFRNEEPASESSKKPFHEKKKEDKAIRESKRPNSHFTEYTPLAMSREKILAEIVVANLTEVGIKPPKAPSQERKGINKSKYYRFHKCHGQTTDDCIHLKDAIELLIQRGRLKQYVKNPETERKAVELIGDGSEHGRTIAMSVEHLGDCPDNVEITPYPCTWEQFPTTNIITGGMLNISMGSMQRKFEELMSVNTMAPSSRGGRPPLAFYDSELPGGGFKFRHSFARASINGQCGCPTSPDRHRGLLRHHVHQPVQNSLTNGEKPFSLRWG
jgi:hypothetical protein